MLYITDVRAFLSVANASGYNLKGDICSKTRYRDSNTDIQIDIDLLSGEINAYAFEFIDEERLMQIKTPLDEHEIRWWLRDIDYLIKERKGETNNN